MTLEEVAAALGITREEVRKIEMGAIRKLRLAADAEYAAAAEDASEVIAKRGEDLGSGMVRGKSGANNYLDETTRTMRPGRRGWYDSRRGSSK